MKSLASLFLLGLGFATAVATEPSSMYNVPGQKRTRNCAPLVSPMVPLRFPDGTPTGFYAYGDDPSRNGSGTDCTNGATELDAQEILSTGAGMALYFRPGGGPDQYVDPVMKGQYGHIWASELTNPPTPQPQNLNGKPCTSFATGSNAFVINLVAVADDGAIYGCSLSTGVFPPQFVLYRWGNEAAPQTVVYSGDPSEGSGIPEEQRWGDTLAVRGAGTNTQILIGSGGTLAAILRPTDASMSAFSSLKVSTDVPSGALISGIAFGPGNTLWCKGRGDVSSQLFQLAFDLSTGTATTLRAFDSSAFPSSVGPLAILVTGNRMAGLDLLPGADLLRIYDFSNSAMPPTLLDRKPFVTTNDNPSFAGALTFAGTNRVYALDSENGIMAFNMVSVATNPLPPLIYLSPSNLVMLAGSNATFHAAADGTLPLSYQWQLNGNNISGETRSDATIVNAQTANAGSYRVIVTNLYGLTTSAAAVLTVQPPPVIERLAYEPFAYASGLLLAGQGGWLLNSGASGSIQAGNLTIPGLAPSLSNHFSWTSASMSVRLPISPLTNGEVYFSFALRVPALGNASSDTIAGFTTGTITTFEPKINIVSNSPGFYNVGIYKNTGLTTGTIATNKFPTTETVFLVARYTFNPGAVDDDTCDLWLNPPAASFGAIDPPIPAVNHVGLGAGRSDLAQIDRFFFRSASSAAQCEADELRIGITWASVTPADVPKLNIGLTGSAVALLWTTNSPGFVLEQQTNSLAFASWTPLTNSPVVSGTNYSVVISASNAVRLFRLRR